MSFIEPIQEAVGNVMYQIGYYGTPVVLIIIAIIMFIGGLDMAIIIIETILEIFRRKDDD